MRKYLYKLLMGVATYIIDVAIHIQYGVRHDNYS